MGASYSTVNGSFSQAVDQQVRQPTTQPNSFDWWVRSIWQSSSPASRWAVHYVQSIQPLSLFGHRLVVIVSKCNLLLIQSYVLAHLSFAVLYGLITACLQLTLRPTSSVLCHRSLAARLPRRSLLRTRTDVASYIVLYIVCHSIWHYIILYYIISYYIILYYIMLCHIIFYYIPRGRGRPPPAVLPQLCSGADLCGGSQVLSPCLAGRLTACSYAIT